MELLNFMNEIFNNIYLYEMYCQAGFISVLHTLLN